MLYYIYDNSEQNYIDLWLLFLPCSIKELQALLNTIDENDALLNSSVCWSDITENTPQQEKCLKVWLIGIY